jgi:hypothetical protein
MTMRVQFFKTPSGEEMAILSRADFERMAALAAEAEEDAADHAVALERKAALDAGEDAPLPAEVSEMLLKGASYLTALRKWRGLTQVQLAERAGVSQGFLSDLESRRRKAGADTMQRLAGALEIPEAWLT